MDIDFTEQSARGIFQDNLLIIDTPYLEEKEREAEFRFPRNQTKLHLHGLPFTHTKAGERVEVIQGDKKAFLTLNLLEGSGHFSLHVSYGKPMEGDLLILTLKTLRRSDKVVFEVLWEPSSSS